MVSSDIVLRKTTGLGIEEVKKHFETSVKEIQILAQTLQNLIGENGRLFVFIDDLDRCSIDNSLEILESIKILFNAKNTKFVVAADMKKLESGWALKHKSVNDPLGEGREHLDKIFQLKLSLPSKILFSRKGEKEKADMLIESYLKGLTDGKKLPINIERLIITAFPPNPRKIKRALSLAYFVGKNMIAIDDTKFEGYFPHLLIWSVCSLYFSELAKEVKKIPYLLPDVCLIVANTLNIGNLKLKLHNLEEKHWTDKSFMFATYIVYFTGETKNTVFKMIEPVATDFVRNQVVDNFYLYRFLKATAQFYGIPGRFDSDSDSAEGYKNLQFKIAVELAEVINTAGLISI